MTCYKPLQGFQSKTPADNGKFPVRFKSSYYADQPIDIPCGQCLGCRLDYSSKWAIRCVHEAQLHDDNCFITLTYDDYHLPADGSLDKSHFQKFMKRLRKKFAPKRIRYFMCGEYGEKFGRPHYHAILFGVDFEDKVLYSERDSVKLYTSKSLSEVWTYGFSSIGSVTFDSAAYVARYAVKKVNGRKAEDHYTAIDPDTGEVNFRTPEYSNCSRRPGVAKAWFDKYGVFCYNGDFLVTPSGARLQPPRYYDSLYEHVNPSDLLRIKQDRADKAMHSLDSTSSERLTVRSIIQQVKFEMLPRLLK